MEKYIIIDKIGEGSDGRVWLAVNSTSGEVVAIKRIKKKYDSWEETLNLREVRCLRMMDHPNIIQLREIVRQYEILYFVFEYMDFNLLQVMRLRERCFSEEEIKNLSFQVLQGLRHMHRKGYFHRDLKPENLLVSDDIIKIADLGMARETFSDRPLTDGATMQWYRAPEVLLHSKNYNHKIDMWAMGAIMAEMFACCPVFQGRCEVDQIDRICEVIGTPTEDTWAEGMALARDWKFKFQECDGTDFATLLPLASDEAVDLIKQLCSWDPRERPTAAEALRHPFFRSCYKVDMYKSPASVFGQQCGPNTSTMVEINCNFSCSEYPTVLAAGTQAATADKSDFSENGDIPPYVLEKYCRKILIMEALAYNFSGLQFPIASTGTQAAIVDKGDCLKENGDIQAGDHGADVHLPAPKQSIKLSKT